MAIDRPTHLADFPAPLADAVARVLRDRGLPASVDRQGDLGVVVVPAERRDEAIDVMAAQMDEIRERAQGSAAAVPGSLEASEELAGQHEPASRPLVSERLRGLWPVPVLLVPLLALLGWAGVRSDLAILVLIGGMAAMVAARQRRRH